MTETLITPRVLEPGKMVTHAPVADSGNKFEQLDPERGVARSEAIAESAERLLRERTLSSVDASEIDASPVKQENIDQFPLQMQAMIRQVAKKFVEKQTPTNSEAISNEEENREAVIDNAGTSSAPVRVLRYKPSGVDIRGVMTEMFSAMDSDQFSAHKESLREFNPAWGRRLSKIPYEQQPASVRQAPEERTFKGDMAVACTEGCRYTRDCLGSARVEVSSPGNVQKCLMKSWNLFCFTVSQKLCSWGARSASTESTPAPTGAGMDHDS